MVRVGIIDCGSNTFNLLIAEVDAEKKWSTLFQNKIAVKLGAGSYETGNITASRFIRGIDALYCHRSNLNNFGCTQWMAFATSAIRDASNGVDFVRAVQQVAGIDVRVLNGDEEAEFIYEGVRQTIDLDDKPALMMDIGGGSTEFIIGDSKKIYWKQSLQLGVSRLFDLVKPSERIRHDEIIELRHILDEHLRGLKEALNQFPCSVLVGSSGSFDTISAMYRHANALPPDAISKLNEIPLAAYPGLHTWLMGSTFAERLAHPVIPELRAEFMPLSSYLIHYILQIHPFTQMYQSAYSLKEGVISRLISEGVVNPGTEDADTVEKA
ncbi:MAG: hypothetical protein RL220_281 [Bacteroidota bacterium]